MGWVEYGVGFHPLAGLAIHDAAGQGSHGLRLLWSVERRASVITLVLAPRRPVELESSGVWANESLAIEPASQPGSFVPCDCASLSVVCMCIWT
jgi:hypothetical protein